MSKNKSWLTRSKLDAIDEKLFEYRDINKAISSRIIEIKIIDNHDSNIGGSKSTRISKPPEDQLLKKESDDEKINNDIKLKNLYLFRDTVEYCYNSLPKEFQLIFEKRWIIGGKTWEEIECELHYAYKSIYKKRVFILEAFAEIAGYIKIG